MAKRSRRRPPLITLTPDDLDLIATADSAVLVMVNGLAHFLEGEGLIEQDVFVTYMSEVVGELAKDGGNPSLVLMLMSHIETMRMREEP